MKRFFILLIAIATFININAAEDNMLYFEATEFNISKHNVWEGWTNVTNTPVTVNLATKMVIIHFEKAERIDYVELKEYKFSGGTCFKSIATDNEYRPIEIEFYFYDAGGCIMKVIYTTFSYKMKLKSL